MGVLFVTLTLRHRRADELAESLDTVLQAWRKVASWQAWRKLSKRLDVVGSIRSTEVTYGDNGWHPHLHLAILTRTPITATERAAFSGELASIWQRAVVALGGRVPSLDRGAVVLAADDGGGIGDYVSKAQEHVGKQRRSIALELARGDLKTGRAGSVMPFELLDDETASPRVRALWTEYVTATKGRRAFGWSRGLRELLIPDEEELTDDEILECAERGDLVRLIAAEDWDRFYRDDPLMLHTVLEEVEVLALDEGEP